jgi:integrase
MAVYKRGQYYHYDFIFAGKRIKESAKTTSKTVARDAERIRRRELEQILAGIAVDRREERVRSVADAVKQYLEGYSVNHRERTTVNAKCRLAHVVRLLGTTLIPELTDSVAKQYMRTRLDEGVCGRTINMELGDLSRAVGRQWSSLWPKLRKLEERKDIGKALSPEEEERLLSVLGRTKSVLGETFVRAALLTGMRYQEILGLTWERTDLQKRVLTVGRAKTASGTGRQIPMNNHLAAILTAHADWFESKFGSRKPEWFLFPFGSPTPQDPSKPATTMKTFWEAVRSQAGIECRFHDLRHTVATKMAEAGVPENTMLALMGHMSRAMLERYSHIRMAAKRDAVESLSYQPKSLSVPPKVTPLRIVDSKLAS